MAAPAAPEYIAIYIVLRMRTRRCPPSVLTPAGDYRTVAHATVAGDGDGWSCRDRPLVACYLGDEAD